MHINRKTFWRGAEIATGCWYAVIFVWATFVEELPPIDKMQPTGRIILIATLICGVVLVGRRIMLDSEQKDDSETQ